MAWCDKDFEESMSSHIDLIYRKRIFSNIDIIDRSSMNETKNLMLDRELGIDSILYFNDGTKLTFQEKTRRFENLKYNDFTFEYYNNPDTGEKGEWFKLASQFYFYGYANENLNGYERYYILKVADFRLFLKNEIGIESLKNKYLRQNGKHGKSNFFAIPFKLIDDKCFLYKSII